jgi:alpha,alpha-trehalase
MNVDPRYPSEVEIESLRIHIDATWDELSRDHRHLIEALDDPKIDCTDDAGNLNLYVSARENFEAVGEALRSRMGDLAFSRISLRVLPLEFDQVQNHGLLYLPGRYVVPGGRFNEFYGWDSYFIQRGLLRGGHNDLAISLVEQALYEVDHYGAVLNANRTYYLTRAHPPVLSMMVRAVYELTRDQEWLGRATPLVEKFYYYWRVPPHLNQPTGLSRYYDLGTGPAPEVVSSERDAEGRTHYDRVAEFLRHEKVEDYDVELYYDRDQNRLTSLAYVGDRSMRESGFDPTNRFGELNLDVIHYAPVCLNVLLYQMERDMEFFYLEMGDDVLAGVWAKRAEESASQVDRYFWNERNGLYFDYHLGKEAQREYPFLTTFWPLWAGIASGNQAAAVVGNLDLFLQAGGLQTSVAVTGAQWDAPFAWAPLQLLAVDGMERYGYRAEAREVARRFTAMVAGSFSRQGILREKYDAVRCSANLHDQIMFGYVTNEPGFGWTNAVLLEFLDRFSDG